MPAEVPPFDPGSVRWVHSFAELEDLCRILEAPGRTLAVFDLETTGLREHWVAARVVTAAVTLVRLGADNRCLEYPLTYLVGLSHPDAPLCSTWRPSLKRLAKALARKGLMISGQNIRFDARWTQALSGIDISHNVVWDTGLSSHLLDENTTSSLKPCAMKAFGIPSWIDFDWSQIEREGRAEAKRRGIPYEKLERILAERVDYYTMSLYNARDTYWTWRLQELHMALLGRTTQAREELLEVGGQDDIEALRLGDYQAQVMLPAVNTITRMEERGITLDLAWCEAKLAECDATVADALWALDDMLTAAWPDIEEKLDESTRTALEGPVSYEPTAGYFKAWATAMVEAGQLRVGAITKGGQASWSKEVLGRQERAGSPAAAQLLAYRRAGNAAQFIRSWLELVSAQGTMHSTYNYYRVVTGRLSCQDPNLQQVNKDLRPAYRARPGFILADADYSQIELRCAAHVSGCEPMINAFLRDEDLHTLMASIINRCPLSEVTEEMRQEAKAGNFGFLYGMGAHKFVTYAEDTYGVKFTEEQAVAVREAFFSTWAGMQEWHNRAAELCRRDGYVKSPLGRIRRLPDIWSPDDYTASAAARQAINSPVQSFASDLTLLAANKIERLGLGFPLALVHDAIVVEVEESRGRELALGIKAAMEDLSTELKRLGVEMRVPLKADVKLGVHWGKGEKL